MNNVEMGQSAGVSTVRGRLADSVCDPHGEFIAEHWRNGVKIGEYRFQNAVTTEGKNKLLNVMFKGTTAITAWYLGLISGSGYTALAAADTVEGINQSANGWDEFASYTDNLNSSSATTRPAWNMGTVSAASLTSSSNSIFDITAAGTIKGIFAVGGANSQTKSNYASGNTLWATALFSAGDVTVANGDQIKITYTVTASS